MSTHSRRSSTTARRRRALAPLPAVIVALAGVAGALWGPAASATADQAQAAPVVRTAEGDEDAPSLSLSLPDYGVVDGEFTAKVTIDNPSDGNPLTAEAGGPLPAGRIVLERGQEAFDSREELDRWQRGADDPTAVEIGSARTEEVPVGRSSRVSVDADVTRAEAGVYPVRARFEPATGTEGSGLADAAALTRSGDDTPAVSMVVPITAPASSRGLLTAEQLDALTAPDGALRRALDGVTGTDAILAVDPAIPAAIRVLGSTAPVAATAWLDDLLALPNDRFALQFGDADVATQLADDPTGLLEPSSFAPYISGAGDVEGAGTGQPTDEPTPAPTPSPDEDPVAMSLDELLSIGDATDDLYWPDPSVAGAETVAALGELGGTAVLPSTTVGSGDRTVPARVGGALVYDADASARLTEAAAEEDPAQRAAALNAAVADLWLASADAKGADLLVALDRTGGVRAAEAQEDEDARPARRSAEGVAAAADAVDGFSGSSLRTLMDERPRTATFAAAEEPLRAGMSAELAEHDAPLADVASVLTDPELLLGRTRAEQLQLLSVSWSGHPGLWRDAFAAHRESLETLESSVGLVPPSDINLLSSEAPLPVWVRNDLPYPVTVTLLSYSDDVRLNLEAATEVEAPPTSNTRVQLPVQSSVGSGDVTIRISIETPTGVRLGDEQTMRVAVRADWERYGVAGLIALIVLLVAAGTVRTVLRRRRRKAVTDGPEEDGEATDPDGLAGERDDEPDAGDAPHDEEDTDGKSR